MLAFFGVLLLGLLTFAFRKLPMTTPDVDNVVGVGESFFVNASLSKENMTQPGITFGVSIFKIDDSLFLNKTILTVSSWLIASNTSKVFLYGPSNEIGLLGKGLIATLQSMFGPDRVIWKKGIKQRYHVLTVSELFSQLQEDADTELVAVINSDIIVEREFMDIVTMVCNNFKEIKNWGMHTGRMDIPSQTHQRLFPLIGTPEFQKELSAFAHSYSGRLWGWGCDIFLWNRLGVFIGEHYYPPFLIGRPRFEYWFINEVRSFGVFLSPFPRYPVYHLDHPEREKWISKGDVPDNLWNAFVEWSNIQYKGFSNKKIRNTVNTDYVIFQ